MKIDEAVAIGQQALIWLSERPDELEAFLTSSGAAPADVRAGAADPAFLGFILDHLMQSDAALLDFAQEAGLKPDRIVRARASLPGGDVPNWT